MLATAQTCAVLGLDGYIVQAEVDISPGLPAFNIVGLPDTAVQEKPRSGCGRHCETAAANFLCAVPRST